MRAMSADMVRANGATFEKIRERLGEDSGEESVPSVQTLAGVLNVSRTTMTNLLDGKEVAFGTLTTRVMPALGDQWPDGVWPGFSLMELIYEDRSTRFQSDPKDFPLKAGESAFGYYLNHDRKSLGSIRWLEEVIAVDKKVERGKRAGHFSLTGTATSPDKFVYQFTLIRLDIHLSVIHATESSGQRYWNSFGGVFTHVIDGALCGVWSGSNLTWRPATYRYVISPVELIPKRLKAICAAAGDDAFLSL
jgi:hypothetical protein